MRRLARTIIVLTLVAIAVLFIVCQSRNPILFIGRMRFEFYHAHILVIRDPGSPFTVDAINPARDLFDAGSFWLAPDFTSVGPGASMFVAVLPWGRFGLPWIGCWFFVYALGPSKREKLKAFPVEAVAKSQEKSQR